MSISADAGQDPGFGASIAPLSQWTMAPPSELVPSGPPLGDFGLVVHEPPPLVREARLVLGTSRDLAQIPDEIEPRKTLKHNASARSAPTIDRTHKGNPFIGLRPAFDTQLRRPGGFAALLAHDVVFVHNENLPSGAFSTEGDFAGPESVETFVPWPDGEMPTTAHSDASSSPRQGGSVMTMRPAAINERLIQGATPVVPRAAALASMTPAPADSRPVEVVALSTLPKSAAVNPAANFTKVPGERPNYAALLGQDQVAHEKRCLAEAIYFEARSEPEEGQAAVAQVVLNRVKSGLYPSTICGVVYQNRQHYHACQFSFACEGRSLRVTEQESWSTAVRIANEVTEGKTYLADVGGSTHYHANYVRPGWARRLEKMDVIGHHIFYKLRPGQT
jgi:spore germination cell wall hydrolase CwlJ-like protein